MSFADPALLAALALCLPVLLAFLVRRRRRVVRVPSTLLFRLAGASRAESHRFRRVRHLASLIACLAAVAALVLAAARPDRGSRGETVAFVVDVSASMEAGGSSSPLSEARRFLSRATAGGPGDRYAVVAAGARPVRLAGPVAPGPALDAAVAGLRAERGGADMAAAIELAASLVGNVEGARVVVLGDGAEVAPGVVSVHEVPVTQRAFPPARRDNLGVASFSTRPAPDTEAEREAVITIATSSERSRTAEVTLRADGRDILSRRLEVPARGDGEVRARVLSAVTKLSVRVRAVDGVDDALAADDEATLTAAARPMPRVLLGAAPSSGDEASPAAFFVAKALAAAGVRDVRHAGPELDGVERRPDDLAVVLDKAPAHRVDLPTLYLGTRGGALPFGGIVELGADAARLRSLEAKEPLLRGVALDGITVEAAVAAKPPAGARSLVDLDGGTVMMAGGIGRGAWIFLGIDPLKSDLVLRVAFPVLVANAMHALGGAADVLVADTVARAEVTLPSAPAPGAAAAAVAAIEPPPRLRLPFAPAVLLALLGAALLGVEAWTYRKGWAS